VSINEEEKTKLEKIQVFYESVYYKNANPNQRILRHNHNLAIKIDLHKNQCILDVGCGKGDWLLAASQKGAKPFGIDLSTKAIQACKTIMPQGEFHVSPAETLPFENDKFAFVSCLGSLEHFINPKQAIQEMIRVANNDARYLILVPNAGFLTRRLGLYKGTHQIDAKEEVLTLQAWNELFDSAGLEVKDMWKDLHVLSWPWILQDKWYMAPIRAIQALALTIWPLHWQYQVYFLCIKKTV
jgi:SAM-dependent methyltransferase